LQAGFLGAYGNTWVGTPAFDALAAEGFAFDWALADSPSLERFFRAAWTGLPAIAADPSEPPASLPALYRRAGGRALLVCDDPAVARLPWVEDFDECEVLSASQVRRPAGSVEETHLAQFFARAAQRVESAEPGTLVWLHSQGLAGTWDAPLELRNRYAEEDDPLPPAGVDPPSRLLPERVDPDELLGFGFAYAGQVAALDECLGLLLAAIDESRLGRDALVIVTAPRGFPLGEHGRLGPCDEPLYEENVHVPLLLRFPDRAGALGRGQALVEPADLFGTLVEWCEGGPGQSEQQTTGRNEFRPTGLLPLVRGEVGKLRDRVLLVSEHDRAIRTPAWYLRVSQQDGEERLELFAKPSDRTEVNEVADRCGEIAVDLAAVLAEGIAGGARELGESLVTIVD
jgi:hypothetical protein